MKDDCRQGLVAALCADRSHVNPGGKDRWVEPTIMASMRGDDAPESIRSWAVRITPGVN